MTLDSGRSRTQIANPEQPGQKMTLYELIPGILERIPRLPVPLQMAIHPPRMDRHAGPQYYRLM
jgi:hypothetical protein